MKFDATVGKVAVSVDGSVITLKNVGKDEGVEIDVGAHKDVSKTITKLVRLNVVKVVEGKKTRKKEAVGA